MEGVQYCLLHQRHASWEAKNKHKNSIATNLSCILHGNLSLGSGCSLKLYLKAFFENPKQDLVTGSHEGSGPTTRACSKRHSSDRYQAQVSKQHASHQESWQYSAKRGHVRLAGKFCLFKGQKQLMLRCSHFFFFLIFWILRLLQLRPDQYFSRNFYFLVDMMPKAPVALPQYYVMASFSSL